MESVEESLGGLLDRSRLDAGATKPEIAAFRIDELFRQLEVEFAPLAREKGLALAFAPSSLAVRSDRRLLRRLLQNLVSNAVKYTPQGRVLVGCRRRGARLRIDVYDTGIGIPSSTGWRPCWRAGAATCSRRPISRARSKPYRAARRDPQDC